jgi:sulfur-oxidizing protein SoxY
LTRYIAWLLAAGVAMHVGTAPRASAATSEDAWPGLAEDVFKGRVIVDGTGLVGIEMPARAEDAAIVPVTLRVALPQGDPRHLKTMTLVIDDNPAPVAATFKIGENAGISTISTRVRVNSYTNVHAVAELSDGQLYMVKTYVKASGGCAAPAAKNADEAAATLGQMKFRQFAKPVEGPASAPREAQIMIRHPNNSGLQRDQVSLLYIPAYFVDELKVWQGDALLFSMEGGISVSEDPNFRFDFRPNGAERFRVEAKDTDGKIYRREWPATASEM